MSPIEIAKAFNAPLLRNGDSNAEVKQLIEEWGDIEVIRSEQQEAGKHKYAVPQSQPPDSSLEIAPPGLVVVPQEGCKFRG